MEFGFDEKKSLANKHKHGIDFYEARALWNDSDRIEVPAKTVEERFLLVGRVRGIHWSVIFTYRGEKVRIISARRARKEEIKIYES